MVAHPTMFGGPCTGPATFTDIPSSDVSFLFRPHTTGRLNRSSIQWEQQIKLTAITSDRNSILSKCLMWTMSSQRRIFISAKCLGRTAGLWRWDTELYEVCCLTFLFVCCSFTTRRVGLSDWRAGCRLRGFQIWPGPPNWPSRPTHRMSGDFWEIPSTRVTNSHISPSCPSRGVSLVIIISPGPPA